jgi:hypothetical protein
MNSKVNGKERLVSLSSIMVDVDEEQGGLWYPLDGICEGIEVKLRSPHCDDFQRGQGMLQQRQKVFNASGEVDTVALDRIFRRCVGEYLLIGWRGIAGEDGKALAWSTELAEEIMRKQVYRKLAAKISILVRKIVNDEEVERAEEGKGSGLESVTTSSSASSPTSIVES